MAAVLNEFPSWKTFEFHDDDAHRHLVEKQIKKKMTFIMHLL